MSDTYCPSFWIILTFIITSLFSIGMILNILRDLAGNSAGTINPMVYFFFLIFVAIAVLSGIIILHMLFPKKCLLPPPAL